MTILYCLLTLLVHRIPSVLLQIHKNISLIGFFFQYRIPSAFIPLRPLNHKSSYGNWKILHIWWSSEAGIISGYAAEVTDRFILIVLCAADSQITAGWVQWHSEEERKKLCHCSERESSTAGQLGTEHVAHVLQGACRDGGKQQKERTGDRRIL